MCTVGRSENRFDLLEEDTPDQTWVYSQEELTKTNQGPHSVVTTAASHKQVEAR